MDFFFNGRNPEGKWTPGRRHKKSAGGENDFDFRPQTKGVAELVAFNANVNQQPATASLKIVLSCPGWF